jgi:hypothetical protein
MDAPLEAADVRNETDVPGCRCEAVPALHILAAMAEVDASPAARKAQRVRLRGEITQITAVALMGRVPESVSGIQSAETDPPVQITNNIL